MSPPTFLFDENVPPPILRAIDSHNQAPSADRIVSFRVGDPYPLAPSIGTLDPDLIAWCEQNDLILVSLDRNSLPGHLADHLCVGGHCPGILILKRRFTIREVVEALRLAAHAGDPDDWRDRVVYFPWTS